MLRFDEGEEVFFDAAEFFSSEESFLVREDLAYGDSVYDIWLELSSVKDRRDKFLRRMGFIDVSTVDGIALNESETMGMCRTVECSEAVTSSCASFADENLVCDRRESNGEANCMVEESEQEFLGNLSTDPERETTEGTCSTVELGSRKEHKHVGDCKHVDLAKKKRLNWWKSFIHKMKKSRDIDVSEARKEGHLTRMKVQQHKKRCMEFTAVYVGQEINAHKGLIWTMKFSPDGQYLATGGEDGVIRIWSVSSVDAPRKILGCNFQSHRIEDKSTFKRNKSEDASVVIPEKVFQISHSPVYEFRGHTSDILDLAWSTSNHLLSSSKDNTVRLWDVGSSECRSVFLHNDYVTCVQFNPVDETYFITGSVDGKVRIWGLPEKRVVNWADVHNIVTAVCYQPKGKGFVSGSVSGTCRFYEISGSEVLLNAEIQICGKKKSSGNKITGIQFLGNDSQRVMITSEDSKIRILDGLDIVHKYKGLTKSGSQMSASFTSSGQHIVSVGEDSRIYVWNYDGVHIQSSKPKNSARSCEHFFFEGVSVALPWSGMGTEENGVRNDCSPPSLQTRNHEDSYSSARDTERFSLGSWFSIDVSSKGSVTWPEEKLPLLEVPSTEQDNRPYDPCNHLQQLQPQNNGQNCRNFSATWGMVIVTAGWDGVIRTFHNYGFPIKI